MPQITLHGKKTWDIFSDSVEDKHTTLTFLLANM